MYITDDKGNPALDENGDKIEYTVEHIDAIEWYKHTEPLHINDDGDIDTEDRNIVIKDATDNDHACSYGQLQTKLLELQTKINNVIKLTETKIFQKILSFRNEQIKNSFHKKNIKIPKIVNRHITLLDANDIKNVEDLTDIVILNVWIKRWDRYHHAKSALTEAAFNNSLEFFYSADNMLYETYFTSYNNGWSMDCIIEYLIKPKEINDIENSDNNNNNNYVPEINVIPVNNNNN